MEEEVIKIRNVDPKIKRMFELGEIRVGTVYGGDIGETEQAFKMMFPSFEVNFFDWSNLPQNIKEPEKGYERWYRFPLKFFSPNSINVFHGLHIPQAEEITEDEITKVYYGIADFIEYYEGGSGYLSENVSKIYRENNIHILMIFPERQDWINYCRCFHHGRRYTIQSDALFTN